MSAWLRSAAGADGPHEVPSGRICCMSADVGLRIRSSTGEPAPTTGSETFAEYDASGVQVNEFTTLNVGSYKALPGFAMVDLAATLLRGRVDPVTPHLVRSLAATLVCAADRVQMLMRADGTVSRGAASHTRARGMIRTTLELTGMGDALPLGQSSEVWSTWVDLLVSRADKLVGAALNALDDADRSPQPWLALTKVPVSGPPATDGGQDA